MYYLLTKRSCLIPKPVILSKVMQAIRPWSFNIRFRVYVLKYTCFTGYIHHQADRCVDVTSQSHLYAHTWGLLPWWRHHPGVWLSLVYTCRKDFPCLTCHIPWRHDTGTSELTAEMQVWEVLRGGQLKLRGLRSRGLKNSDVSVQGRGSRHGVQGNRARSGRELGGQEETWSDLVPTLRPTGWHFP